MDEVDLLGRVLDALDGAGIRYCVVGGQAVNAYVDPLVSLDLDLALAAGETERVERLFAADAALRLESFPHSLNLSSPGSDLRVQFQTDPRYSELPSRAEPRTVLGREMPVAAAGDVLQGKIWAASDATRRASKRQKDLADISRLLEAFPELSDQVPQDLRERLL